MLQIQNLQNKKLLRNAWQKVLAHMKARDNFIPDRNWILYCLLPDTSARILDIGPNVYLFKDLLEPEKFKKYSYQAMDIVKRYDDPSINQTAHDANIGPYPFPDVSFDLIIASDVIEHLRDTDVFLREVVRLLKPDGQFFCTTPNYASLFCIVKVLRGRMFHDPLGKDADKYCFQEHFKYFTHKDLVPYMQNYGLFANVIIAHDLKTDIDFVLKHGFKGKILMSVFNALSRLSVRFSPEIMLIASRKPGRRKIVRV